VKRRSIGRAPVAVEQLGIGFEGLEVVEPPQHEPAPDTMQKIVSLRMPDALMARVEQAAEARGVSPSSLMRALIAAGLDRSYAAVREPSDMAAELADLRRSVERLATRLERGEGVGSNDPGEPEGG
jgi:Ribbon-helix-helix protein, copG family